RAAMHLHHRHHPAGDQWLALAAFHGRLSLFAGLSCRRHSFLDGDGLRSISGPYFTPNHSESPMAGSVNKVILVGNLGADPEIKSFSNGGRICNLRIATSESWNDRASGERKERTEWHSVVIRSDGLIGIAERYL